MHDGAQRESDRMQSRLTAEAIALYKHAVANPAWTPDTAAAQLGLPTDRIEEATRLLGALRLFRPSLDPDRGMDPVGPQAAVAELLLTDELEIQRRQAEMATVRDEMLSLLPTYFEARRLRRTSEAIDVIEDVEMVRELLADRATRTTSTLFIAHPGSGMSEDGLDRSLSLDIPMLRRGVVMQSVLQHSTRHHLPTQRYVREVSGLGAGVRTVPIVPRRLIVFDREAAFIPMEGGDSSKGAVLVQEPAVVDHLVAQFELLWHNGRPFPVGDPDDGAEAQDEIVRAILDRMAAGAKDELIARQLGISLRTCRRYIATITGDLGAQSRFQAGALAQQRGLLDGSPVDF